jgi:hypothetical protein
VTDINIVFARALLRMTMSEVKPLTTAEERKTAWVYHSLRDGWEFRGPNGFYWYGSADNAYHARQQGWAAWLTHLASDAATMRVRLANQRERARKS